MVCMLAMPGKIFREKSHANDHAVKERVPTAPPLALRQGQTISYSIVFKRLKLTHKAKIDARKFTRRPV